MVRQSGGRVRWRRNQRGLRLWVVLETDKYIEGGSVSLTLILLYSGHRSAGLCSCFFQASLQLATPCGHST